MIANAERNEKGEYTDIGNLSLTVGELFASYIHDSIHSHEFGSSITFKDVREKGQTLASSKDNPFAKNYGLIFGYKDGAGVKLSHILYS